MQKEERFRLFQEEKRLEKKASKVLSFSKLIAFVSIAVFMWVLYQGKEYANYAMQNQVENQDASFWVAAVSAAGVFAAAAVTFYYKKSQLENIKKICTGSIKELILFKKRSGLYSQDELEERIDSAIDDQESEFMDVLKANAQVAEEQQDISF